MSQKPLDLIGERFGKLVVESRLPRKSAASRNSRWLCRCDCGNTRDVSGKELRSGSSKSCGCLQKESVASRNFKHGWTGSVEHQAWLSAKKRCFDHNSQAFKDYGARGITMCKEWADEFSAFIRDMGKCPKGCTLERIRNDEDYKPGNCKWATRLEQTNNRRVTVFVETEKGRMPLAEAATEYGIHYRSLYHYVVMKNLPFAEALAKSRKLIERSLSP